MTTEVKKIELTDEQKIEREAFKRKMAYLKGALCGYAKSMGMKHESTKPQTPAFEAGWKEGSWKGRRAITGWHILYNQLKGKKPHTGDVKKDAEFESERRYAEKYLNLFMEAANG